jgi:copper oxidase (laccase) domain-containing protein
MHKLISAVSGDVDCWYIGVASGGFSEKYAPGVGDQNLDILRRKHGAKSGTLLIPSSGYEVTVLESHEMIVPAAAIITAEREHGLLLRPADCIPLVLYSLSSAPILALIHCGRRELDADSIARTIMTLQNDFGIPSNELGAYVGPGIKQRSYRLPLATVSELKHRSWKRNTQVVDDNNVLLDIFGFSVYELERHGIRGDNIVVSSINTATNPKYYSHYASTRHGVVTGLNGFMAIISHE